MKEMPIDSKSTALCLSLAKGLSLWSVPSFMDHLQAISSDTVLSSACLVFGGSSTEIVWSRQGAGHNVAWATPIFAIIS